MLPGKKTEFLAAYEDVSIVCIVRIQRLKRLEHVLRMAGQLKNCTREYFLYSLSKTSVDFLYSMIQGWLRNRWKDSVLRRSQDKRFPCS